MHYFKKIDLFGSEIRWKFMKEHQYRSIFGSIITLFLFALFITKIVLFVNKINTFGFARNQISFLFRDDVPSQLTNFSDFQMIIYAPELNNMLKTYQNKTKMTNDQINNYSINDYFNFKFVPLNQNDVQLKLKEIPCQSTDDLAALASSDKIDDFKCLQFDENYDSFIISRNDTLLVIDKNKGLKADISLRKLKQFSINIEMTQRLYDFLNENKQNVQVLIMIKNFFLNSDDFSLRQVLSIFEYTTDLFLKNDLEVTLHKISIEQVFEFDVWDFSFSNLDNYSIDEDSFRLIQYPRKSTNNYDKNIHFDSIEFSFDVLEEINYITFLTLDNIMAVLGGFMQIIITLFGTIAEFYNHFGIIKEFKKINHKKLDKYGLLYDNVRQNCIMQAMKFNNKSINNEKFHSIENHNELKLKKDIIKSNNMNEVEMELKDQSQHNFEEMNKRFVKLEYPGSIEKVYIGKKENESEKFLNEKKENIDDIESVSNDEKQIQKSVIDKLKSLTVSKKNHKKKINFEIIDLVSTERYLDLFSEFETFKLFYFDKFNKINIESLSKIFIYSENFELETDEFNQKCKYENVYETNLRQEKLFLKLINLLEKY